MVNQLLPQKLDGGAKRFTCYSDGEGSRFALCMSTEDGSQRRRSRLWGLVPLLNLGSSGAGDLSGTHEVILILNETADSLNIECKCL